MYYSLCERIYSRSVAHATTWQARGGRGGAVHARQRVRRTHCHCRPHDLCDRVHTCRMRSLRTLLQSPRTHWGRGAAWAAS